MGTRGGVVAAGYVVAGVGIAAWAVLTTVVWPLAYDALSSHGPWQIGDGYGDDVEAFRALHRDVRWASILLAFGGLLLLARARRRERGVAVGMAVWAVANVAIDIVPARGWVAVGFAAVVTAGVLVLLLPRPGSRNDRVGPGWSSTAEPRSLLRPCGG